MFKISTRETVLLILLIAAVFFLLFFFIIIGPAQDNFSDKKVQLATLQSQKVAMDNTIAAGKSLASLKIDYENQAVEFEGTLLPTIKSEVIAQILQQKFVDAGIPFFVTTESASPQYYQTMMPDGSFSPNQLLSVRYMLKVSGSDGVFPTILDPVDSEAPSLIGFKEFTTALKDIEDDLPASIKIYSISLEDSKAGFMYYQVEVDAFAYSLPDRLSAPDMDQTYVNWQGQDVTTLDLGGTVGIPFMLIPPTSFPPDVERPYTLLQITPEMILEKSLFSELYNPDATSDPAVTDPAVTDPAA